MSKRVVVIGATGSGKSTLANVLAGKGPDDDLFPAGHNMVAKTHVTTVKRVKWRGEADSFDIDIIDTPGLDDPAGPKKDADNIAEMVKELKKLGHVNLFLIVFNGAKARLDRTMKELLRIFKDMFGPEFLDNTMFEVTNWGYDKGALRKRKMQNAKTETSWGQDLNANLRQDIGLNPSKDIPAVFIDSMYDPDDETHVLEFEMNLGRLRIKLENASNFSSDDFKEAKRDVQQAEEKADEMERQRQEAIKEKMQAQERAKRAEDDRKMAEAARERERKEERERSAQREKEFMQKQAESKWQIQVAEGFCGNNDDNRDKMSSLYPWKQDSWYVCSYDPCGGFYDHCGSGGEMKMRHHGHNLMFGHSKSVASQQQVQAFRDAVNSSSSGDARAVHDHIKNYLKNRGFPGYAMIHVVHWGNGFRCRGGGPAYYSQNKDGQFSAGILF